MQFLVIIFLSLSERNIWSSELDDLGASKDTQQSVAK